MKVSCLEKFRNVDQTVCSVETIFHTRKPDVQDTFRWDCHFKIAFSLSK